MTKELVTIEFRYRDITKDGLDYRHISKTVTIGVYDTFDEAIEAGNKVLELLELRFPLHVFPKGNKAAKERFSKNGGCFGSANRLVTNLAYLKTPFEFYAKIQQLKYDDVDLSILEVLDATKRYREFKLKELE